MDEGLRILAEVKRELGVPVLTDVHASDEIEQPSASVVDVLQTPAFLCRQTDFIHAVRACGQAGQHQEGPVPRAARHEERDRQGARRGARSGPVRRPLHGLRARRVFGYNNLVSDMRSLAIMRETDAPVVFDATHSVQLPGGQGTSSGGQREFVPVLARAAVAVGVAGLFMETHPNPAEAQVGRPERGAAASAWRALLETLVDARPGRQARAVARERFQCSNALARGARVLVPTGTMFRPAIQVALNEFNVISEETMSAIVDIVGREILDSRGNPTVECDVLLESGTMGRAAVPSGASTGSREAIELRDGDNRAATAARACCKAVEHINTEISEAIMGLDASEQAFLDRR